MNVIDNALGKNQFDHLSGSILSHAMSWQYAKNTALDNVTESGLDYSFAHLVFDCDYSSHQPETQLFTGCYLALLTCLDKLGLELDELFRIRVGLITNKGTSYQHHMHVDDLLRNNYSIGILYVTSNQDCPTIVKDGLHSINIDHKQNTFALFDGDKLHCSTSPTLEAARVNINYNFRLKCTHQDVIL